MYLVAWESDKYGAEWESFDGLDEAATEYSRILEGGREDIDNVRSVSLCSVRQEFTADDGDNGSTRSYRVAGYYPAGAGLSVITPGKASVDR